MLELCHTYQRLVKIRTLDGLSQWAAIGYNSRREEKPLYFPSLSVAARNDRSLLEPMAENFAERLHTWVSVKSHIQLQCKRELIT